MKYPVDDPKKTGWGAGTNDCFTVKDGCVYVELNGNTNKLCSLSNLPFTIDSLTTLLADSLLSLNNKK